MGTAGLSPVKISFNLRNDSRQMHCPHTLWGFPGGSDAKESASNAGGLGSVSELGRSQEKGMAAPSSILAWRIPWTEETCGVPESWT